MDLTVMERVGDRWEKNGRILFDRPKPLVGCSANGRRRRKFRKVFSLTKYNKVCSMKLYWAVLMRLCTLLR
jgi:hypothetical protein